jgi:SAM-dependent methyltransferase
MTEANAEQRAYWNRDEARHWVDQQRRYDEMLEPFGAAVLAAASITATEHVLDIGCGSGAITRLAARSAHDGAALGVDLSEAMVDRARDTARTEGVENVNFEVDDAQTHAFDPIYDCVISRFGVMFFDDPVAAFTNIRRALRPGGRVAVAVWRELLANSWMMVPVGAALAHVPAPNPGTPGAPGPYALADPDRVRAIFDDSGFRDPSIEPFRSPMLVGGRGNVDEAVEFLFNTGMGQGLLSDASPELRTRVIGAVHDALSAHATSEGVRLDGAAWIVTATR